MATLKKIVNEIKEIVNNNVIYNTVEWGDLWEIDGKEINYPCVWIDSNQSPHTLTSSVKKYELSILFFDIVNKDESNELEIQSDAIESASDFIIYLENNYDTLDFYTQEGDYSVQSFSERWNDQVSGCMLTMTVTTKAGGNLCKNIFVNND